MTMTMSLRRSVYAIIVLSHVMWNFGAQAQTQSCGEHCYPGECIVGSCLDGKCGGDGCKSCGETCVDDAQCLYGSCLPDLTCGGDGCLSCGEICEDDAQCFSGTCIEVLGIGGIAHVVCDGDCFGACCIEGNCFNTDGESLCATGEGNWAGSGTSCFEEGICDLDKGCGESCVADWQCTSGSCGNETGVCSGDKCRECGEKCSNDWQCFSGDCDDEKFVCRDDDDCRTCGEGCSDGSQCFSGHCDEEGECGGNECGACCPPALSGECQYTSREVCFNTPGLGGRAIWDGGEKCTEDICVTGACCGGKEGECLEIAEFTCDHDDGVFLGRGTACIDEETCPVVLPCGETCVVDGQCDSKCCLKQDQLNFSPQAAPLSTRKLQPSEGLCTEKKWCDCADQVEETEGAGAADFVGCVTPCPFECDEAKPIDMLKVRWKGEEPIHDVIGVNGKKCDDEDVLFDEYQVSPGDHVEFRASASTEGELKKDLTVCIYDPETEEYEPLSMFHVSCSDKDLQDETACFEYQGDGKTKSKKKGKKRGKTEQLVNTWKLVKLSGPAGSMGDMRVTLNCGIDTSDH